MLVEIARDFFLNYSFFIIHHSLNLKLVSSSFKQSLKIEQQSIHTLLKYNDPSRHRFDLFAIRHIRENVSVSP